MYQVFGGYRDKVPCYVTCAYYQDGKDNVQLKDEITKLVAEGHQGFKGKVGFSLFLCIAYSIRKILGYFSALLLTVPFEYRALRC